MIESIDYITHQCKVYDFITHRQLKTNKSPAFYEEPWSES